MIDKTEEEITKNWGAWDINKPLVSIRCITYNHEKYISQALDGFLMQKTNFPFEVIVHDDASTDKTADIIREYEKKYPSIIKPIYEVENQYSKPGYPLAKIVNSALKGKYIAFCEGDDYWIDPYKLQKQVEFLETNVDYGMCYARAKAYVQRKKKFKKEILGEYVEDIINLFNNVYYKNRPGITTCTVLLRKELFQNYHSEINPSEKKWLFGDIPLWCYFYQNAKVYFDSSVVSVYRILTNSACHHNDVERAVAFKKSRKDMGNFFVNHYNLNYTIPDFDEHIIRAHCLLKNNKRKEALSEFRKANSFSKKDNILRFLCSNIFLYQIVRIRYVIVDKA